MPETKFENRQEARVARSRSDQPDHHNTLVIRRDAKVAFLLFTEAGLSIYAGREFKITGDALEVEGETDDEASIPYGNYELFVGDGRFVIPAVHPDEQHHPVHVHNALLPDVRDAWDSPTPEELEGGPPE